MARNYEEGTDASNRFAKASLFLLPKAGHGTLRTPRSV
jgi:hypothetical protein